MANPLLRASTFAKQMYEADSTTKTMTINGTITKSLILFLTVIAGAAYTWNYFNTAIDPSTTSKWIWGGAIVGFITALIISFKPKLAQYLSPIYALAEGLFLGAISAILNDALKYECPNLVLNAVSLTILTAVIMLAVYRTGIIKVNGAFIKIMTVSIVSVGVFYLGSIILRLFGIDVTMLHDSGWLSIAISSVIVLIAAFSLIMDFEFIKRNSEIGAPKYMEWYGAFSLIVTLVWLYLEILKLLAKLSRR